jgi:capsular polysaccharide transport system permease protein
MATDNLASPPRPQSGKFKTPFRAALRQHARVISALLQREAISRSRTPLESVIALLEPLIMISVLGTAYYFFARLPPYGSSSILFLSTGFIPFYLFIYVSRRMRRSVESSMHRLAAEEALDYIFVHVILRCIDYTILSIFLFSMLYMFFTPNAYPTSFVPILEGMGAMALFGFGVGILNLAISNAFPLWRYFFPAISRGLMLFSGIHFVPDLLSPGVRYVLSFNPMSHAITLFRLGFYPQYPQLTLDRGYLAISILVAIFLGLVAERVFRRYMD